MVLLFPDAELQEGPDATPVERARERVNALVQEIADGGEQVLVPSPALAEVLATPDCDMEEVLSTLRVSAFIRIGDFDQRAAADLATRLRAAVARGDIREGLKTTKTKMKFDRQIVAIALTNGARVLYSDDHGVRTVRMASTNAATAAAAAVDAAYDLGGGTSIYDTSLSQRRFRDVHAATQHMLVAPATWELTGRLLLGLQTDTAQL